MTTKPGVLRPFGRRGPQGPPDAGSPLTKDRRASAADQIWITHNRTATGVVAGAEVLRKAPGRGWSAWLANVKRRRRLAREERLERREQQSGEYVADRRHPPHWL